METSFQAGHANVHLHGACFLHRRARPMPGTDGITMAGGVRFRTDCRTVAVGVRFRRPRHASTDGSTAAVGVRFRRTLLASTAGRTVADGVRFRLTRAARAGARKDASDELAK